MNDDLMERLDDVASEVYFNLDDMLSRHFPDIDDDEALRHIALALGSDIADGYQAWIGL